MKKITAIILTLAAAACLTACDRSDKPHEDSPGNSSVNSEGNSSGSFEDSDNEAPVSYPDRSVRYVYGEVEIPDFTAEELYYNRFHNSDGRGRLTEDEVKRTLGSMVFKTKEVGGYKYSLVGEDVRTDIEEHYTGIFARRLYIEVEKDGAVTGQADVFPRDDFGFRVDARSLGDDDENVYWHCFDVYEMDYPILAVFNYPDSGNTDEAEFFAVKEGVPMPLTGDYTALGGTGSEPFDTDDSYRFYAPYEDNILLNLDSGKRFVFDPEKIAGGSSPQYTADSYYERPSDTPEPPEYLTKNLVDRSYFDEKLAESDILFPTEFTEDDLELQAFLKETSARANFLVTMIYDANCADGAMDNINELRYFFPQLKEPMEEQRGQFYYPIADEYPKTLEEMRTRLEEYFTADAVEGFMSNVAKGELIENADGTPSFMITEGRFDDEGYLVYTPQFIECDGRLYRDEGIGTSRIVGCWDSARIISRSDTDILFTFINDFPLFYYRTGHLVYEDGWKYAWRIFWQF